MYAEFIPFAAKSSMNGEQMNGVNSAERYGVTLV